MECKRGKLLSLILLTNLFEIQITKCNCVTDSDFIYLLYKLFGERFGRLSMIKALYHDT